MTTHTETQISPYPWVANRKALGNFLIVDAKNGFVATTHTDTPEGNGPLIASAPALLAALETLLKEETRDDDDPILAIARDQARAAIAAAKAP